MATRQKLIHIHSNVYSNGIVKAPTSESLEYGELAINYNSTEPCLFLKDVDDNIRQISTNDTVLSKAVLGETYSVPEIEDDSELIITKDDSAVTAIGKLVKTLEDNEEIIAAAMNDINERVDAYDATIEDVNTTISNVNSAVETLSGTVENINGSIEEINTKLDGISASVSQEYEGVEYNSKLSEAGITFENVEAGDTLDAVANKLENNVSTIVDVIIENEEIVAGAICDLSKLSDKVTELEGRPYQISDDYQAVEYNGLLEAMELSEFTPVEAMDTLDTVATKLDTNISKLVDIVIENEFITSNTLNELNDRFDNVKPPVVEDYYKPVTYPEIITGEYVFNAVQPNDTLTQAVDKIDGNLSKLVEVTLDNELATAEALNVLNERLIAVEENGGNVSAPSVSYEGGTYVDVTNGVIDVKTGTTSTTVAVGNHSHAEFASLASQASLNELSETVTEIGNRTTIQSAQTATVAATASQTEYSLNIEAGAYSNPMLRSGSNKTFNGSNEITINIPTNTTHLINDSGYLTPDSEEITGLQSDVSTLSTKAANSASTLNTAISNEVTARTNAINATNTNVGTLSGSVVDNITTINNNIATINNNITTMNNNTNTLSGSVVTNKNDISTISGKVDKLVGADSNKSVRTIASEVLASELIPSNAKDSLNTLQEIAAWIQKHPDDASAMNTSITNLQTDVNTLKNAGYITTGATVSKANSATTAVSATTAASAAAVAWTNVSGRPSSLPASDVSAWAKASTKPSYTYTEVGAAAASHTHDDRYYTETEMNTKLAGKSDTGHTHSNYLTGITKSQVTTALGYTPPSADTNTWRSITSATGNSTDISMSQSGATALYNTLNNKFAGYSLSSHTHSYAAASHTHDDRYYTETEMNTKLAGKSDTGHSHSNYLTSHQTIYDLTFSAGAFTAGTFDPNGAAKTINVPTHTSHLTNNSGFITTASTVSKANSATTAASAASVAWGNVSGKPSSFTPAAHTHDFITYESGHTSCTSLSNIAVTKRLVICTVSASGSFSVASTPADGREVHVMVKNSGSSDITVTLPTASPYVNLTGDSITVAAGGWAEINVLSDGTNRFLRAL